ncbi:hypothetical protein F2Q69_00006935 [Brassica cretica]|uniref:Uncharacterized protein n=1 Tax=Brassica cretica TaxID=69181 RepID=A0A8S9P1D1_BRACR|nr:hypothetical protein F2Q69_00006935 [Brassica cretica]
MSDGGCRSMGDVCLRSIVVSEYRSTGVSGSTGVDRNRSMDRWCYRSMRRVLLCGLNAPSLQDVRPSRVRAWSLRSDRAVCVIGRYVATELRWSSVAMSRPSHVHARSLCSD